MMMIDESGYGTQYPAPSAPPPPGYPGYEGYPPPQGYGGGGYGQQHHRPGGYQGYFNDGYPPPPPPPPPPQPYPHTQVYHCEHYHRQEDGCFSFLKGW